jgi:hypothetical protein
MSCGLRWKSSADEDQVLRPVLLTRTVAELEERRTFTVEGFVSPRIGRGGRRSEDRDEKASLEEAEPRQRDPARTESPD